MKSQYLKKIKLSDSPGIYIFKNAQKKPLYIGRATSLRDRVKSYFSNDIIETRGLLIVDMLTKVKSIDWKETDSVLEAIILESNLIKKYQPYFNTKEKDNRSYNYIVITDEEFPRIIMLRGRNLESENIDKLKFKIKKQFGPYPQGNLLKDALKIIRKIFPFRDERSGLKYYDNFYHSIGLSPDISFKDEYKRTIRNLILFFQGKKSALMKTLGKEMNEYAERQEFEKAKEIRNTLYALTHIKDVSLIKKDNDLSRTGFRIEAYDIAHMSGKDTVGVMTVAIDGEIEKSEYKKFKISKDKNNDTEALKEILRRRFNHTEWKFPDLIIVDGGIAQKNIASSIVKNIPIVSVVKDDKHKADHILGDKILIDKYKDIIIKLNVEAHRFAISYHKKLRGKTFLQNKL